MQSFSMRSLELPHEVLQGNAADEFGELLHGAGQIGGTKLGGAARCGRTDHEAEAGLLAAQDGNARNLDLLEGAVSAVHDGGEVAHRAVLAQIRGQHVDVDARPAQPFFERLAARLLLVRKLRQIEEGRVRRENVRVQDP